MSLRLRHALEWARQAGFSAMQFNFVVSTNSRAIALWKNLGFSIVGTRPQAFQHQSLGRKVDVFVMHRFLDAPHASLEVDRALRRSMNERVAARKQRSRDGALDPPAT